jgi:predicted small secreted protein
MIRAFVMLTLLAGVSACGTIQGVGRDITSAGQALERVVR